MTKIQKIIIIILAILSVAVIGLGVAWAIRGTAKAAKPHYYALATEVVEINRETDVVTCEDCNGNLWEFYGAEDWEIGDNANLLMNSKGTPKIEDDEICGATYANWDLSH